MRLHFSANAAGHGVRAADHAGLLRQHYRFDVTWASSEADVQDAQRLRYRIFAQEMGARLAPAPGTAEGLDVDRFDRFCEHLLVRACGMDDDGPGQLVGTYRVLGPAAARRAGGYYADTEFDLGALALLRPRAVELGRACVHPDWRSGGVILALWAALGKYMLRHELDTMIGCASISLCDGGQLAAALWQRLRRTHLAERQWQVRPLHPFALGTSHDQAPETAGARGDPTPPLIKGYLRCGAKVLGPPCLDQAFNSADLPIMLRLDELAARYRQQFLSI